MHLMPTASIRDAGCLKRGKVSQISTVPLCLFYEFEQAILIRQAFRFFIEFVPQTSINFFYQVFIVCVKSDPHRRFTPGPDHMGQRSGKLGPFLWVVLLSCALVK